MTDITNKVGFAQAVIAALGRTEQTGAIVGLVAWATKEGGNWENDAKYNPLNTTMDMEGAESINGVGVKAYTSWDQGIEATVNTLNLDAYAQVRVAIGAGDAEAMSAAVAASPWGTGSFAAFIPAAATEVAEALSPPEPAPAPTPAPAPAKPAPKGKTAPDPGPTAPPFPGRDLIDGVVGEDVREWQSKMHERGWSITVDGDYGPASEGICKDFQAQKGLSVDGIVGPITWAATWTSPVTAG